MGWGFRAAAVVAALVEALICFFGKKEGKVGICFFLLHVSFSSVMRHGGYQVYLL
jgi:hypothetical protein